MGDESEIEKGVALLRYFLDDREDKKAALDLAELVTGRPDLQREILRAAGRYRPVESSRDVSPVEREVEGSCLRCGRQISRGYFLDTPGGEIGPFGSTCIERVKS
ncbi:MAG: hypothetical protein MAG715_00153 [Methanonatronarchaeales archaeon]|nr:hypothetical protein [Methanonatronarchaeales archaeon]